MSAAPTLAPGTDVPPSFNMTCCIIWYHLYPWISLKSMSCCHFVQEEKEHRNGHDDDRWKSVTWISLDPWVWVRKAAALWITRQFAMGFRRQQEIVWFLYNAVMCLSLHTSQLAPTEICISNHPTPAPSRQPGNPPSLHNHCEGSPIKSHSSNWVSSL